MNKMAVHEAMGRLALDQLASAPTSRPAKVVNQPSRLRATGAIVLTTPRQFPANRARGPVKKHPDRLLAAAPVMFGKYHATFLAAEALASSVHRNILCPRAAVLHLQIAPNKPPAAVVPGPFWRVCWICCVSAPPW